MTSLPPAGSAFPPISHEGNNLEQRAGALRDEVFGKRVFVRGVIEGFELLPAELLLLRDAAR